MRHRLAPVLAFAAVVGGCGLGRRPAEPAGDLLYRRYCASCHGTAGRGDGPVAPALKKPPTDLTGLARARGGKFPHDDLMAVIDGRRLVDGHGTRDMPVWGAVFDAELKHEPYTEEATLLRAATLSAYLRSIQVP